MKNITAKISLFILIGVIISGCSTTRRIPNGKKLLAKNEIIVNNKSENSENIVSQLYQKPNSDILGYNLRLHIYNLAKPNPDSSYKAKFIKDPEKYTRQSKWLSKKQVDRLGNSFYYRGIHDFLKKTGEAPVIIDDKSTARSVIRLKTYYFDHGFFNTKVTSQVDSLGLNKGKVKYLVTTGVPYTNDSLNVKIKSFQLDSLYNINKTKTLIKKGKKYKKEDFDAERSRITTDFRNNGAYYFQQNYITYSIDTVNTKNTANVDLKIKDLETRVGDSSITRPFKLYKISRVNIYTDYSVNKTKNKISDSVSYNNFHFYSTSKLKYRPKSIANAIFINKGNYFADYRTNLTSRYISNLKIFNYPSIQYTVDKNDPKENSLIANIYLTPLKKFGLSYDLGVNHSNIQEFGILGNATLTIRNVFNGAETFEISGRGNIGASKDLANPKNNFFNISEYGVDMKLNFPRIFFLFNTEKIIPKNMIPSTSLSAGFAKQVNIGLDKENLTSSLTYNWTPKRNSTARLDLINIQFVKNLNTENYFNVYENNYTSLNEIAQKTEYNVDPNYFDANNNLIIEEGTNSFINDVLSEPQIIATSKEDYNAVKSIDERKNRLTENNLIFGTSFTYSKTTKADIKDDSYYAIRTKIESVGNLLSLITKPSQKLRNLNGANTLFGVEYSQYIKYELEFIKHWDLSRKNIFGLRSFVGIAVPYGNSNNIPFSRSYFAGGSNDNRAWQPYGLGPGSTGAVDDFNEANLKIALSAEYRFKILSSLNGALFVDAGNIWNVFDNIEDTKAVFSGLSSLKNSAIGSGFGVRYDLSFFVVRIDIGFKTYNPAYDVSKKWFRDYNFGNSVLNIGINYPF